MRSKDKWLKKYPMIDYKKINSKNIRNSVSEKISKQKDEVILMKNKKFKTFAIVGAIIAVSATSVFTVNAATDGAITKTVEEWIDNITVFIDGKEVGVPAKMKRIDDSCVEFEVEIGSDDENGDNEHNIMIYEEGEDEKPLMEIYDSRYETDSSEVFDPSDFKSTDSENK